MGKNVGHSALSLDYILLQLTSYIQFCSSCPFLPIEYAKQISPKIQTFWLHPGYWETDSAASKIYLDLNSEKHK